MKGVRIRDGLWEGQCDACLDWWPIGPGPEAEACWRRHRGLRICLACQRDAERPRRLRAERAAERAANKRATNREWMRGDRERKRQEAAA